MYGDYKMAHFDDRVTTFSALLNRRQYARDHCCRFRPRPRSEVVLYTYSVTPFSSEQQQCFTPASTPVGCLNYPIETHLFCYDLDPAELEEQTEFPQLLEELDGFKLWHLQDHQFQYLKVWCISPSTAHTQWLAENIVKTRVQRCS
ncbi:hypothetical protein O9929_05090 [Vibrio lentus]|nr:hypothetical protein [Vibrio lentus]